MDITKKLKRIIAVSCICAKGKTFRHSALELLSVSKKGRLSYSHSLWAKAHRLTRSFKSLQTLQKIAYVEIISIMTKSLFSKPLQGLQRFGIGI